MLLFYSSGRKFDKNGDIVKEWWSKSSLKEFNKKSKCIEKQYSKYKVQGRYPVRCVFMSWSPKQLLHFLAVGYIWYLSLRKQPSFFAPSPSGVSREGRLFSQARYK